MIGEELVFFCFLYIKLFELGVKVALSHQSAVTHHKVNLLKFPLRSSSFERTDDAFVLLNCFCIFHLSEPLIPICRPFKFYKYIRSSEPHWLRPHPVACPRNDLRRKTLDRGCTAPLDFFGQVLSPLYPVPSPSDLPCCRFWETLLVATACSCYFLCQAWRTWACSLAFVQRACCHTGASTWSGGQLWSEDCFYYYSERNYVVILFGTLRVRSFILTEVNDCGLLIVVTSSTFLKGKDMSKEKSS